MENKENTKYWDQVNQPPKHALKVIQAGRLKGKSDISPQWRYKVLTEIFGPCGIGWKFNIDALWTESGSDGQIFAFAKILLFVKEGQEWSEPIPGIGGSMLVIKEKAGLHSNDECFKMAVTDALSTACKMLGVAADVYMGLWDGAKYINVGEKSKSGFGPDELLFVDQANRLIALIESDQTVEDLKKRHTDNKPLIKTFPDDLKKKAMAAINARHAEIIGGQSDIDKQFHKEFTFHKHAATVKLITENVKTLAKELNTTEEEVKKNALQDPDAFRTGIENVARKASEGSSDKSKSETNTEVPIWDKETPEPQKSQDFGQGDTDFTNVEKKIIELKEILGSIPKENVLEAYKGMKNQIDKLPLDAQEIIRKYRNELLGK